jgi:hypothetical protein
LLVPQLGLLEDLCWVRPLVHLPVWARSVL